MIAELHRLGFRLAVWTSPYLATDSPVYEMAEENGWLVTGETFLNPFGIPVDFTNPDAMTWWPKQTPTTPPKMAEDNPFRLPPDDEIFLMREQERRKRAEERELAKNLKAWRGECPGSGREVPRLPPAVNLSVPAGTALVWDGRLG